MNFNFGLLWFLRYGKKFFVCWKFSPISLLCTTCQKSFSSFYKTFHVKFFFTFLFDFFTLLECGNFQFLLWHFRYFTKCVHFQLFNACCKFSFFFCVTFPSLSWFEVCLTVDFMLCSYVIILLSVLWIKSANWLSQWKMKDVHQRNEIKKEKVFIYLLWNGKAFCETWENFVFNFLFTLLHFVISSSLVYEIYWVLEVWNRTKQFASPQFYKIFTVKSAKSD